MRYGILLVLPITVVALGLGILLALVLPLWILVFIESILLILLGSSLMGRRR